MQGTIKRIESMETVLPLVRETMPDDVYEMAAGAEDGPNRKLFGFYAGKKLLGCCGYVWEGKDYSISWTAVLPGYQREGIGQQLLDRVFRELKKLGASRVYVETYEHPDFFNAVRWYWKNGFRLCGFLDDYLRDGSKYLYLKKEF